MTALTNVIAGFDYSKPYTVPGQWYQGRTVYGGLTVALAIEAARQAFTDLPPLRTMQVMFVAPVMGALEFKPQILRQGKSVVSISVDCLYEGQVATRISLMYAQHRASKIVHDFTPCPTVTKPEDYPAIPMAAVAGMPEFVKHFEIRPVAGAAPLSGAAVPEMLCWVRHTDATGVDAGAGIAALADFMPPSAMTSFTEQAPVSTITWTMDLIAPLPATEWGLIHLAAHQTHHGYSTEDMQIWNTKGELVLAGRQTVAIFA